MAPRYPTYAQADPVSEAIGRLSAHVENLQFDMKQSNDIREADRRDSTDQRRRLYEEMEAGKRVALETKNTVETLQSTMEKITPIVADYQTNKNRALGILISLGGLASAIGWLISEFRIYLVNLFHH